MSLFLKLKKKSYKKYLNTFYGFLFLAFLIAHIIVYFNISIHIGNAEEPAVEAMVQTQETESIKTEEDFFPVKEPEVINDDFTEETKNNSDLSKIYLPLDIDIEEEAFQNINGETKSIIKIKLQDEMIKKIGIGNQPTDEEVNGNREFSKNTKIANELSKQLDEKCMDEKLLQQIIKLREDAYSIYQTTSLRKLLANNYTKLGKYYYQKSQDDKAIDCLQKSIQYECAYLEMMQADDSEYYVHLYNIGMIYHLMGDFDMLQFEKRMQAYLFSSCFLDISAERLGADKKKYMFYSNYYAGMVNYKILLNIEITANEMNDIIISDAIKDFENSLLIEDYRKQRKLQYDYIVKLCRIMKRYNNSYGESEYLGKWSDINNLQDKYSKLIIDL